jgi:hypothetical protein
MVGEFNTKVASEYIFKLTIANESLHEICSGVRVVNFAIFKNLTVKSTIFPHHNIHKYTWTYPDGKTRKQTDHILIDRQWCSGVFDVQSFRAADYDSDHYLVVAKLGRD